MAWNSYMSVIFSEVIFILFTAWFFLIRFKSKFDIFLLFIIFTFYSVIIFFSNNWYSINYYLRYVNVILYVLVLFVCYKKSKELSLWNKKRIRDWTFMCIKLISLALIVIINFSVISAFFYTEKPVELSFPFKNGTYCIVDGGNGKLGKALNTHYKNHLYDINFAQSVQYAMDIVKINNSGFSSKGIFPKENKSYELFGDTIYSPCDGEIIFTWDSFEDSEPFGTNITGVNTILMNYKDDIYIVFGHLKKDSILVNIGDKIKKGQPLAEAGNSGSPIPHLHIEAIKSDNLQYGTITRDKYGTPYFGGKSIPILFDGRFPVRNMLFTGYEN